MAQTESNEIVELALEFINNADKSVFLTGKAGTGKTTFLNCLKERTFKRFAIVAPTGIAAINANGVTIHSFFNIPFGPLVPIKNPFTIIVDGTTRRLLQELQLPFANVLSHLS